MFLSENSVKCFTVEHDFTFFVMCNFVRYVQGFQFSDDLTHCLPHFVQYAKYIIYGVVHVRYPSFKDFLSFHTITATRILIYFFSGLYIVRITMHHWIPMIGKPFTCTKY